MESTKLAAQILQAAIWEGADTVDVLGLLFTQDKGTVTYRDDSFTLSVTIQECWSEGSTLDVLITFLKGCRGIRPDIDEMLTARGE